MLELGGCTRIGPDGAKALAEVLPKTDSLRALGLRACKVCGAGAKHGLYAFVRALERNMSLRTVDLSANEINDWGARELALVHVVELGGGEDLVVEERGGAWSLDLQKTQELRAAS